MSVMERYFNNGQNPSPKKRGFDEKDLRRPPPKNPELLRDLTVCI
jgi:hypothetical protein